jgi:hypothetical protein
MAIADFERNMRFSRAIIFLHFDARNGFGHYNAVGLQRRQTGQTRPFERSPISFRTANSNHDLRGSRENRGRSTSDGRILRMMPDWRHSLCPLHQNGMVYVLLNCERRCEAQLKAGLRMKPHVVSRLFLANVTDGRARAPRFVGNPRTEMAGLAPRRLLVPGPSTVNPPLDTPPADLQPRPSASREACHGGRRSAI